MLFSVSCEHGNTKKKDLITKQQFADTKQWRQPGLEPRALDPELNAQSPVHRASNRIQPVKSARK